MRKVMRIAIGVVGLLALLFEYAVIEWLMQ